MARPCAPFTGESKHGRLLHFFCECRRNAGEVRAGGHTRIVPAFVQRPEQTHAALPVALE